ncbi:MAG: hypothetical protein DRQ45_01525 [Gammaproteobacteria bacterium]|nr:MAG: hypothetical protein DRQ45_01525 [Gammaproteobacteria bacterium]
MTAKTSSLLGLLIAVSAISANAMGIRSFVALPLEKGGTVVRLFGERNQDQDVNVLTTNLAYGITAKQTLFLGLPYRLSPDGGDRLGDVSALYRYTTWQADTMQGTSRLGLLGGVVVPTDSDRDVRLQAGAVATFYRQRHEWDLDALWIEGLGDARDRARYDIAWQYRLTPAEYPEWGIGSEWDLDLELGGRWERGNDMVHQATIGLQSIHKRWVLEGAVVKDLNGPGDTRFILSTRVHF